MSTISIGRAGLIFTVLDAPKTIPTGCVLAFDHQGRLTWASAGDVIVAVAMEDLNTDLVVWSGPSRDPWLTSGVRNATPEERARLDTQREQENP